MFSQITLVGAPFASLWPFYLQDVLADDREAVSLGIREDERAASGLRAAGAGADRPGDVQREHQRAAVVLCGAGGYGNLDIPLEHFSRVYGIPHTPCVTL